MEAEKENPDFLIQMIKILNINTEFMNIKIITPITVQTT